MTTFDELFSTISRLVGAINLLEQLWGTSGQQEAVQNLVAHGDSAKAVLASSGWEETED
jgi:hypothetical protein